MFWGHQYGNTRISNRVETAEMMIAIGNTDMTLPIINNNYPGIRQAIIIIMEQDF